MIHLFECLDNYFVYDVYSGALHMIDELAYGVLSMYNDNFDDDAIIEGLSNKFDEESISHVLDEIKQLEKDGQLFTTLDYNTIEPLAHDRIKAMCLHVAHDCNLRCKYCFASKGAFGGNRTLMSYEVGKKALDFLVKNSGDGKALEVDFFGGEPLMNFDVVKKLTYYGRKLEKKHGKEFKFTLTTNAYEMDADIMEFLNEEMFNVVISLDGREEVHNFMRPNDKGEGSQSKILDNAKQFVKLRGEKDHYIRGTFTRNNLDFANDVMFLANQGFEQMSIEPVVADQKLSYAIKNEDLEIIKKEYERLAKWYYEFRKEKFVNFFHFMISLDNGPCLIKRLSGCGAGFEYIAVTPEGDIYPCHQYVGIDEMKLATVDDDTLDAKKAKEFSENNVLNKPHCQNCWAQFWCGGGCGANAYKFNGDLKKPYEMECEMLKKRLECSMAVYCLENS